MALLFSQVTMCDGKNKTKFLASGYPQKSEDLEGWAAYHNFLDAITESTNVKIHMDTYLYGEGKTFSAAHEEVAYLTMRNERDPRFLAEHCTKIGEADFDMSWYSDEVFGQDFIEL